MAKYLRKVTITLLMFVCMEQCDSHRTDFREISYLGFSLKSVDTFRLWLEPDKNSGQSA
jgi:hypothetical protein